MSDHVYVYGIIDAANGDLSIDEEGISGGTVDTVERDGLAAVTSPVDTTSPERTDEAIERHDAVLRAVMNGDDGDGRTIVPMQFGMAFVDEARLQTVLAGATPAFERALSELDGAVELGVKVIRTNGAGSPSLAETARAMDDHLDPIADERVDGDRFSELLLANRSYLVAREHRDDFGEAVGALEETLGGGVEIQYTGPWPPYNFVDIRVGADG